MMKEKNCMGRCSLRGRITLRLISLLIVVILSHPVSVQAENILSESSYQLNYININIHENGFADIEEGLEVNNTIIRIFTPNDLQDVLIQDSRGNILEYDSTPVDDMRLLTFYLKSSDEKNIRLSYSTFDLTCKDGPLWTFRFSTSSVPGHTIVKVDFPRGADVIDLKPKDLLRSPKNLTTSMMLYPQTTEFSFEYDYRINQSNNGGEDNSFYVEGIIILFIVLAAVIYALTRKKDSADDANMSNHLGEARKDAANGSAEVINGPEETHDLGMDVSHIDDITLMDCSKKTRIKSSVLNMLEENEQKVVELIMGSDDEITQAYIYKTTGIPKATLSNLMKRLENRNIIERRRDGRTNWIKLQEWIFTK